MRRRTKPRKIASEVCREPPHEPVRQRREVLRVFSEGGDTEDLPNDHILTSQYAASALERTWKQRIGHERSLAELIFETVGVRSGSSV
jgi:hypothetical protein